MKERIFMAEMRIAAKKLYQVEALQIDLEISRPPEARAYRQPPNPVPYDTGYPLLTPERNRHYGTGYETRQPGSNLENSTNVRVNAVSVNVRTKHV